MRQKNFLCVITILLGITLLFSGCGSKEEKDKTKAARTPAPAPTAAVNPVAPPVNTEKTAVGPAGVICEIDGVTLTQRELDKELNEKMPAMKGKVPAAKMAEIRQTMRKRVIEDFIVRTLLAQEIKRKNIKAGEQEINAAVEQLKASFPPGTTIESLMKKNKITKEKMRQEIAFGIKVNKLVLSQPKAKEKPTDKEIQNFYKKNKDKFKMPETVRVRHILIAKAAADDEKIKQEKKNKAEGLRKQLLAGGNFAELAKNNSDCPSKQAGGDLGTFTRGQMVKPFEDAAFSQKVNDIGPVVETDFGYHIIQVQEKNSARIMPLDAKTKDMITAFLQRQKQQEAFNLLIKDLRSKANVILYQP